MSIYPRTNYEMTEEDLTTLMEAFKPVPMIMLQCVSGPSQQERANRAWEKLGQKMGFDYMTVRPDSRGNRFFTAVPSETDKQELEREQQKAEEMRLNRIDILNREIRIKEIELYKIRDNITVQLDGNSWCATGPGFIDLQSSHAGFGDTPNEAVIELRKANKKDSMGQENI